MHSIPVFPTSPYGTNHPLLLPPLLHFESFRFDPPRLPVPEINEVSGTMPVMRFKDLPVRANLV